MEIEQQSGAVDDTAVEAERRGDFIRNIIRADLADGKHTGIVTRFPPEPNGYLHIGHAKSVCLNFGVAEEFGGVCALRFDDTNPGKESIDFVEAIKEDVGWLGFDWSQRLFHASDYFEQLYGFALELIKTGKAYVDSLSAEETRELRGTLTTSGSDSPYRNRSVEENLDLFQRMRAGEFADGAHVLRAKIDMGSANINLRDPTIYRIRRISHQMTGDAWCIYPMYDYTQCLSDAIEGVTHSLCTLEFEDHRPLYDWVLDNVSAPSHPRQIEFARLNLNYTVLSKRKLIELVQQGHVNGWDDPRLPTLSGMRRRGFTAAAIRDFCQRIGITKKDAVIDMELLENSLREDLDRSAPRAMAVLRPLKVVIENYPEGQVEELEAVNHPRDPGRGTRKLPFGREIYIERDDFMEDPPRKFFRLAPGREVRLRFAYIIRCESVVKDPSTGEILELRCSYDPETRSGGPQSNRKVKGTLHWVSASHALEAEIRLYDRLFAVAAPDADKERPFTEFLNPNSMATLSGCRLEPSLGSAAAGSHWQFERQGYFCVDTRDSVPERPVFNRAVTLRDTWAKLAKQ